MSSGTLCLKSFGPCTVASLACSGQVTRTDIPQLVLVRNTSLQVWDAHSDASDDSDVSEAESMELELSLDSIIYEMVCYVTYLRRPDASQLGCLLLLTEEGKCLLLAYDQTARKLVEIASAQLLPPAEVCN